MPGYKGHIFFSLLFCGVLYFFPFWQSLSITGKLICIAICVFFGLWPDVDTKSKGQTIFLLLFLTANGFLIYRGEYKRAAYLGLLIVLPLMSRHRGWTHSIVAMILIPGAVYLIFVQYTGSHYYDILPYFLAALLGYSSHLAADNFF